MSREQIVAEVKEWLGTPYSHRASVKGIGVDCIGLIVGVYRELSGTKIPLPVYSPGCYENKINEKLIEEFSNILPKVEFPIPGDILVFRYVKNISAKHCGILVSTKKFVHCMTNNVVKENSFNKFYKGCLVCSFSFPKDIL